MVQSLTLPSPEAIKKYAYSADSDDASETDSESDVTGVVVTYCHEEVFAKIDAQAPSMKAAKDAKMYYLRMAN